MASPWIKIEVSTPDKPEVWRMAQILDIDPDAVVGKLIRLWAWCDANLSASGNADVTIKPLLDRVTTKPGFADALEKVGWLKIDGDALQFCNFDRHNGQSSKNRALTSRRVAAHRQNVTQPVTEDVTQPVTVAALTEKRREEKSTIAPCSPPQAGDGDQLLQAEPAEPPLPFPSAAFADAWRDWRQHRSEIRKPLRKTAAAKQLKQLREMGEARAIAAIGHSIACSYQGIFEAQPHNGRKNGGGYPVADDRDRIVADIRAEQEKTAAREKNRAARFAPPDGWESAMADIYGDEWNTTPDGEPKGLTWRFIVEEHPDTEKEVRQWLRERATKKGGAV